MFAFKNEFNFGFGALLNVDRKLDFIFLLKLIRRYPYPPQSKYKNKGFSTHEVVEHKWHPRGDIFGKIVVLHYGFVTLNSWVYSLRVNYES